MVALHQKHDSDVRQRLLVLLNLLEHGRAVVVKSHNFRLSALHLAGETDQLAEFVDCVGELLRRDQGGALFRGSIILGFEDFHLVLFVGFLTSYHRRRSGWFRRVFLVFFHIFHVGSFVLFLLFFVLLFFQILNFLHGVYLLFAGRFELNPWYPRSAEPRTEQVDSERHQGDAPHDPRSNASLGAKHRNPSQKAESSIVLPPDTAGVFLSPKRSRGEEKRHRFVAVPRHIARRTHPPRPDRGAVTGRRAVSPRGWRQASHRSSTLACIADIHRPTL